jgi:hypothetical protein
VTATSPIVAEDPRLAAERERAAEILASANPPDEYTAQWIAAIESGRFIEWMDQHPAPPRRGSCPRHPTERIADCQGCERLIEQAEARDW